MRSGYVVGVRAAAVAQVGSCFPRAYSLFCHKCHACSMAFPAFLSQVFLTVVGHHTKRGLLITSTLLTKYRLPSSLF